MNNSAVKSVRGQSARKKNPLADLNANQIGSHLNKSMSGITHHSQSNRDMATVLMVNHEEKVHTRKPSRFELTTALYGEDETILAKMGKNARYTNSTGK